MDEKTLKAKSDLSSEALAKGDALRLLGIRPRSTEELRGKLKQKKYDTGTIDRVIEDFKKKGLLDDVKFAKLLAHSRVHSKPMGLKQLRFEFKRRGVSKEAAEAALGGLGAVDEKATEKELVRKRFERMKDLPAEKRKARLYAFLRRRGFENDTIFAVLSDLVKEDISNE